MADKGKGVLVVGGLGLAVLAAYLLTRKVKPLGAEFSVSLGFTPLTPKVGDMIIWWALIKNIGTVEGTSTVSWYRNNILITTSTVPLLGPGTMRLIYGSSFSLATPGDHILAVVVNGASDSVTITVLEEAGEF